MCTRCWSVQCRWSTDESFFSDVSWSTIGCVDWLGELTSISGVCRTNEVWLSLSILVRQSFFVLCSALVRSHSSNSIRFLSIYIAEAHASDQWPVGKTISCVSQSTTLEERLNNARYFQMKFNLKVPMLVDNMRNTFHLTYGSWPFRFYVFYQTKLVLKAQPQEENFAYNMDQLDHWIDHFYQSKYPIA